MNYQPVRAFFLVFGMGCLIWYFFHGLCMWLLNIYLGKIISFAVIMASVLLVTRVEYMPPWMIHTLFQVDGQTLEIFRRIQLMDFQ